MENLGINVCFLSSGYSMLFDNQIINDLFADPLNPLCPLSLWLPHYDWRHTYCTNAGIL